MISTINTLGLRVDDISPEKFKTKVNVNSDISVSFNSDLDSSTIFDNFKLLKDDGFKYADGKIKESDFETVIGNITYKDRTVVFTPFLPLTINCRYIIYIPENGVRDVLGNTMLVDFISYFSTESYSALGTCEILEPENNKTLSSLNKISLSNVDGEKYLIQISKTKTFDNLVLEKVINTNLLEEDLKLGDGLYYIRAKAMNGVFGENCVITIKTHANTIPTDQDLDEDYIWEEYTEDKIELLESFPKGIDVNEKTNIMYMKFNKILDIDNIDFFESLIVGDFSDSDYDESSSINVDGSYTVVLNEEKSETYVFFIPNSL